MDNRMIEHIFSHHPPKSEDVGKRHEDVRDKCKELALHLNSVLPASDEKNEALRALDRVCQWSNAAIARYPEGATL